MFDSLTFLAPFVGVAFLFGFALYCLCQALPLASTELLRALGEQIVVKTSGTRPSGVSVPIDASATFVQTSTHSEVRISKTREELKTLGLVPANDEDGVDEMAWLDMAAAGSSQSLVDSEAFAGLGHADRGTASRLDPLRTLDSSPPNSVPSESYFKAAGREIVMATCGGVTSGRRQIMNQADVFYFSGHGDHSANRLQGRFTPQMAEGMWDRDLDCVIISGCSVLDINDYGNNYVGAEHLRSPGKVWERTGPAKLLGYCYIAPGDAGGAPTRIVNAWRVKRTAMGDVDAWMAANAENSAWNACAIEKGQRYLYFQRGFLHRRTLKSVPKVEW